MNNSVKAKYSPLHDEHEKSNARFTDFAGWQLPVHYSGIINEHLHTRNLCSIFDISHMGEFIISGESALKDLENLHTANITNLQQGRCKYGFLLDKKGFVIDDTIIYKYSNTKYMLVVNAGCIQKDYKWIKAHISEDTELTDISGQTAKIDVQGPFSRIKIEEIFKEIDFYNLKRFCFTEADFKGNKIVISATGYTGEKGYEIFLPFEAAADLWSRLLKADETEPAGLGARDSLRLEKGYSLYGHEIDEKHTPLESNLARFINFNKDFLGKEALVKQKKTGLQRILVPFICENRRAARTDYEIYLGDNKIGIVTSGVYSPVLKKGIGMCFIDANYAVTGNVLKCVKDNIEINAVIVELPFVK